ncbi:hypothetical protein, partial [Pseudomonas sp. FEN]
GRPDRQQTPNFLADAAQRDGGCLRRAKREKPRPRFHPRQTEPLCHPGYPLHRRVRVGAVRHREAGTALCRRL